MDHSVKRRRQALHQTHHHYYLNISVEAANLSDSVARIESNQIETFLPELECSTEGKTPTSQYNNNNNNDRLTALDPGQPG